MILDDLTSKLMSYEKEYERVRRKLKKRDVEKKALRDQAKIL